ncbi:MAG: pyridoxal 5'-phosphate synthase glutaminase subunit PdxT [Thaumarchaeota archaeon]|nr:pyridoxal 5'-phosphate synthase glutaminase subunit PdxT [Nitrososphaerota archaeon]MDE0525181.1 pyridoxal 5'-phosphate synthase glutaminase subunit PdxT [Nitrososphaerota archaeon]
MSDGGGRKGVRIGVLAVQGDVAENVAAVSSALKAPRGFEDDAVLQVKTAGEISRLDGLVIPGGESTAIGRLSAAGGVLDAIRTRVNDDGMPILGICAGLILLARSADDRTVGRLDGQQLLGVLDVEVQRNAFGRQRQSFETKLDIRPLAISNFKGVFIRAPVVCGTGPGVEALCELPPGAGDSSGGDDADGGGGDDAATDAGGSPRRRIVAVRKGDIIGTAFHPELSGDLAIHQYFVDAVRRKMRG